MIESGQITRMSQKWLVDPGTHCDPTETTPLAMQNVCLTFAIIGAAFVLSLMILAVELIISCCSER